MKDDERDLEEALAPKDEEAGFLARLRKGTIVTAPGGGVVTLTIGGGTSAVPAKHLDSYAPVAGDDVWLLTFDRDRLVIGKQA